MVGILRDIVASNDIFFSTIAGLVPEKHFTHNLDDFSDATLSSGYGKTQTKRKLKAQAKLSKRSKLDRDGNSVDKMPSGHVDCPVEQSVGGHTSSAENGCPPLTLRLPGPQGMHRAACGFAAVFQRDL
jgi:60S ribosome biogenesis protein Rrp14